MIKNQYIEISPFRKYLNLYTQLTYISSKKMDNDIRGEVRTPIGLVRKVPANYELHSYWRQLQLTQARKIKNYLVQLLEEWSIVTLATGKIDGHGYGCCISDTNQGGCGQKFIIDPSEKLSGQEQPPHAYQQKNNQNNHEKNQQYTQKNQQQSYPSKQHVKTPIGPVCKISSSQPIPYGWRLLQIYQGRQYKSYLNKLLDTWSIVSFRTGKIDGRGYGNSIHETYGGECGERFIIKMENLDVYGVFFLNGMYDWNQNLLEEVVVLFQRSQ